MTSPSSDSNVMDDREEEECPPSTSGYGSEVETAVDAMQDVGGMVGRIARHEIDLAAALDEPTKYAVSSFVATILALDFLERRPYNRPFVESTIEVVTRALALPPATRESLRLLATQEVRTETDHITSLITHIRQSEYLQKHGALTLIAAFVHIFINTGVYDSRERAVLRHMSALINVKWEDVVCVEDSLAHLLVEENFVETVPAVEARKKEERMKKVKRFAMIGVAGTVGGVLIGLTGGLAAPLVASGAGVLIGATTAAGIATTAGAAVIGTLFGVGGAGFAGYKMKKRVGCVEEFVVETLNDGQALHTAIAVSGWIEADTPEAFRWPWRHLEVSSEQYTIRYETTYLLELGRAMDYFMTMALSFAVQQTLMETAFAGLLTAIAWPVAILSVASAIDNPWNVGIRRSQEVGHHLADLLLRRQQGRRPVTLLGFSLGARVIYHCLLHMSTRPECHGIVQDVYLLGAPVAGSAKEWAKVSQVVGGRIVNGYCGSDWLLRFVYRTMSAQMFIAGTAPITGTGCNNIHNVDLSHIVKGHMDYRLKLRECLQAVGVPVKEHRVDTFTNLQLAVNSSAGRRVQSEQTLGRGEGETRRTTASDSHIVLSSGTIDEADYVSR